MGREGEVVSQLIPAFEKEHPGIKVEVQQIPWSAAHEKLLTAYVGDATPDIAMLGNTWVPEFSAVDALEPLDTRVASSTDAPKSPSTPPAPISVYSTGAADTYTEYPGFHSR